MGIVLALQPAPTFTAPVEIPQPGDAPALVLDVTWRHKGQKALLAWCKKAASEGHSDLDTIDEVVTGWDDIKAGVPYSREALAQLLDDFPAAALAFAKTYQAELLGARRKNSPRSPSPGQPAASANSSAPKPPRSD